VSLAGINSAIGNQIVNIVSLASVSVSHNRVHNQFQPNISPQISATKSDVISLSAGKNMSHQIYMTLDITFDSA
jgi:hypothetical protein